MIAEVDIPNSGTRTTRLGVGMATLMREPSPAVQQRLLHAAHDAGFRHFDVAPSYGLGAAERVLGRFLRTRPEGVTVATKVGIVARGNTSLMRMIQQPARALLRRFPGLRGRATRAVGGVVHVPTDFSIESCRRSLEQSLRALGRDTIDLYLLHDAQPADVAGGAIADWLASLVELGTIRAAGVASSPLAASAIVGSNPGVFAVAQVPSHILAPAVESLPREAAPLRVTHGVLATPLGAIGGRLHDASWVAHINDLLGEDIRQPGVAARMLLAWGLLENPRGIVLVGASKESHLRSAPSAIRAFDKDRLTAAATFVRSTLTAG